MKSEVIAICGVGVGLASIILIGGWALWSDVKADFRDARSGLGDVRNSVAGNKGSLGGLTTKLEEHGRRLGKIEDTLTEYDARFDGIELALAGADIRVSEAEETPAGSGPEAGPDAPLEMAAVDYTVDVASADTFAAAEIAEAPAAPADDAAADFDVAVVAEVQADSSEAEKIVTAFAETRHWVEREICRAAVKTYFFLEAKPADAADKAGYFGFVSAADNVYSCRLEGERVLFKWQDNLGETLTSGSATFRLLDGVLTIRTDMKTEKFGEK